MARSGGTHQRRLADGFFGGFCFEIGGFRVEALGKTVIDLWIYEVLKLISFSSLMVENGRECEEDGPKRRPIR